MRRKLFSNSNMIMCSRILPLAATIAVWVSCGGSRAVAAEETPGSGIIGFGEFLGMEATAAGEGTTGVTLDPKGIYFDGPYYKADLEWDGGQVSFGNLHVCAAGHTAVDLPIMDTRAWSSSERKAGIYFMESLTGVGLNLIKCKDPENIVQGDGTISLEWDDLYGYRSFKMRLEEGSATIEGYDPKTGDPVDNWFLSLITAREKTYELPFTVIVPQRVNSEENGREYHLDIGTGKVSINTEDTPPVLNIYPDNGTVRLVFNGN